MRNSIINWKWLLFLVQCRTSNAFLVINYMDTLYTYKTFNKYSNKNVSKEANVKNFKWEYCARNKEFMYCKHCKFPHVCQKIADGVVFECVSWEVFFYRNLRIHILSYLYIRDCANIPTYHVLSLSLYFSLIPLQLPF